MEMMKESGGELLCLDAIETLRLWDISVDWERMEPLVGSLTRVQSLDWLEPKIPETGICHPFNNLRQIRTCASLPGIALVAANQTTLQALNIFAIKPALFAGFYEVVVGCTALRTVTLNAETVGLEEQALLLLSLDSFAQHCQQRHIHLGLNLRFHSSIPIYQCLSRLRGLSQYLETLTIDEWNLDRSPSLEATHNPSAPHDYQKDFVSFPRLRRLDLDVNHWTTFVEPSALSSLPAILHLLQHRFFPFVDDLTLNVESPVVDYVADLAHLVTLRCMPHLIRIAGQLAIVEKDGSLSVEPSWSSGVGLQMQELLEQVCDDQDIGHVWQWE